MLGAFIQGFEIEGRDFAGTSFDFLTPFSILTGVALVFGYGLLGAGWLILKTEGEMQERARRSGRISLIGVLIGIGAVSLWTPLVSPEIAERWFSWPNSLFLSPVPMLTLLAAFLTWRALNGTTEAGAFIGAVVPVRAVLSRHRHQPVAVHRAAHVHAVGGGLLAQHPGLPAGRHAVPAAGDPGLHRLVLLGVPRQGARRHRLSLRTAHGRSPRLT